MKKTTIVIMVLLALSLVLVACVPKQVDTTPIVEDELPTQLDLAESICAQQGGNWLKEHNECEGLSQEFCINLGGSFDACASACRHEPGTAICTMQCVIVCDFTQVEEPTAPEIPLDCTSWFDGCNTCTVQDGELGGCTRMYCAPEAMQEPECLAFS